MTGCENGMRRWGEMGSATGGAPNRDAGLLHVQEQRAWCRAGIELTARAARRFPWPLRSPCWGGKPERSGFARSRARKADIQMTWNSPLVQMKSNAEQGQRRPRAAGAGQLRQLLRLRQEIAESACARCPSPSAARTAKRPGKPPSSARRQLNARRGTSSLFLDM